MLVTARNDDFLPPMTANDFTKAACWPSQHMAYASIEIFLPISIYVRPHAMASIASADSEAKILKNRTEI